MATILRQVGEIARAGARGNDDVGSRKNTLFAVGVGNLDIVVRHHPGGTHNDIDVVFLEQELNTLAHSLGHTARALHHSRQIGIGGLGVDTVGGGMVDIVEYLSALEESLGGDATPVKANTAQVFTFDDSCFHAQLRGFDGSHITTRAATYDN